MFPRFLSFFKIIMYKYLSFLFSNITPTCKHTIFHLKTKHSIEQTQNHIKHNETIMMALLKWATQYDNLLQKKMFCVYKTPQTTLHNSNPPSRTPKKNTIIVIVPLCTLFSPGMNKHTPNIQKKNTNKQINS